MTRALVTGGAGYFGEVLARKLLDQGFAVRIFDLNQPHPPLPGVEVVQGDIRNAAAVSDSCAGMDVVFHNVAQVPLAKNRKLFWSVNRDGTENLLQSCLNQGVKKVIHTSSSAIYGVPQSNPVTEDTPPSPREDYGLAKLASEEVCQVYAARGLDISIIRPRTIMGHGRLGIFQILFEWIFCGSNIPVLDDGKNLYQFIHASDLADACILASARTGPEDYNCGTDRFGTMREVLEHLCQFAGTGSSVRSLPMKPAVMAMTTCSALGISPLGPYHALMYGRSMYFDISKAHSQLSWKPHYSNNEMFVESYRWYVENRAAVLARSSAASIHRLPVKQRALSILRHFL